MAVLEWGLFTQFVQRLAALNKKDSAPTVDDDGRGWCSHCACNFCNKKQEEHEE